jgi:hypothetical protein
MKCHLFVFEDNPAAIDFWHDLGWTHRQELVMMSTWILPDETPPVSSV